MKLLDGKKTNIICVLLVAVAVGGLLTEKFSFDQFVQLIGMAGIGAGLRDAIAKS